MKYNFIFDYETIGQDVFKIPVVNCSFYVFDWDRFTSDNPYTFKELINEIQFVKFDIKKQLEDGAKYNKRDLQWWKDQGPDVFKQLTPSPEDKTVEEFCSIIYDYLRPYKLQYWWSRSNTFDPILLQRNFAQYSTREKMDEVLPYWKVRDIRTYIDTRYDFKLRNNNFCPIDDEELWNKYFIAHNSIHDVSADILRLQRIERVINEKD